MFTYGDFLMVGLFVIIFEGIVLLILTMVYSFLLGFAVLAVFYGLLRWLDIICPELKRGGVGYDH
jgi:hypothetical protein